MQCFEADRHSGQPLFCGAVPSSSQSSPPGHSKKLESIGSFNVTLQISRKFSRNAVGHEGAPDGKSGSTQNLKLNRGIAMVVIRLSKVNLPGWGQKSCAGQ
jgi:hypothetical protein